MSFKQEPLDLDDLRYEPLAERPSKVALADLGRPCASRVSLDDWIDRLPRQLAGSSFRKLRDAIVESHASNKPVIAALGGHVIKTGCGPYLIDWVRRGVLSGLALNGAAAIHDLELAIAGHTSEEVGPQLIAGDFGFAAETSDLFVALYSRPRAVDRLGSGTWRRRSRTRRSGTRFEPFGRSAAKSTFL